MAIDYQKSIFDTDDSALLEHMKRFNISQKMLDESIDQIVSYFEMQPHLPKLNKDDPRIKRLLFISSYSIEKTKSKLESLFTARSVMPDFFANRDSRGEEFTKFLKAVDIVIMPNLTPEKYRVIIFRLISTDLDLFDLSTFNKINFMVADFRLSYETTFQDVYVMDFSMITAGHAAKINPLVLKKSSFLTQECYATKVKSVNIMSVPSYIQNFVTLSKAMIKKKIADRFKVHRDLNSLHNSIPKECLPKEYGGTGESCQVLKEKLFSCLKTDEWRQRLIDYENEKSNESIRPDSSKNTFKFSSGSIEGSFRTLDFD